MTLFNVLCLFFVYKLWQSKNLDEDLNEYLDDHANRD